jgi:phosphomannomutase
MSLMVSISGVRGIIGESLTPDVVIRYASAFAEYCKRRNRKPTVMIGRDGRVSGRDLAHVVSTALMNAGVNVGDLGICPTPTVQLAVEHSDAAGGISITASHNPIQWNGLKFLGTSGMFLDADENKELWAIADSITFPRPSSPSPGHQMSDSSWIQRHCDLVLSLSFLNVETIKRKLFKVVVDCINGSGGVIVPELLRKLGCVVIELNCDVSGLFAHTPEPIPENLGQLCTKVRDERADIGIAVDPDGDRLVLITEKGEPYGEEYTIASVVKFVLQKNDQHRKRTTGKPPDGTRPKVVVNLSTTRAVEDIAEEYGAELIRTPVGEINVAKKMKEVDALVGGEGSGGIILPAIHLGRDAIVGIPLVLQLFAEHGGTLSQLKSSLPEYAICKGKVELGRVSPDVVLEQIRSGLAKMGTINTDDGLRIGFRDSWVHIRKSNTEPILRIIAEARTAAEADRIVQQFRNSVEQIAARS